MRQAFPTLAFDDRVSGQGGGKTCQARLPEQLRREAIQDTVYAAGEVMVTGRIFRRREHSTLVKVVDHRVCISATAIYAKAQVAAVFFVHLLYSRFSRTVPNMQYLPAPVPQEESYLF